MQRGSPGWEQTDMRIEFEIKDEFCVLRLRGRFATGSNAEYLQTRDELQKTGCRKVIADCREASYLDSTGIALVVLQKTLGGRIPPR